MVYLGIDVSKAKLHCCLLCNDAGTGKSTVVDNTSTGIATLLAWTAKQGATPEHLHAIMAATGVYHESAAQALFEASVRVSLVNPAQAKDFARGLAVRTKTDGVDGFSLARLGALLKPHAWQPPPPKCVSYKPCWPGGRPSRRTCAANAIARKRLWPQPRPSVSSNPLRTPSLS